MTTRKYTHSFENRDKKASNAYINQLFIDMLITPFLHYVAILIYIIYNLFTLYQLIFCLQHNLFHINQN